MNFKTYEELCEALEEEVEEIKNRKEKSKIMLYKDLCTLKDLLSCIKDIKTIVAMKEADYMKGEY